MDMNDIPCASQYGAPMGKFYLRRVRLDAGGYDAGGAYYGGGAPLYRFESECGAVCDWIRARSRQDAKSQIRAAYPGARFFR